MKKPKMFRKIAATVAALVMVATATAACGGNDEKEITIGYIAWDEAVAASNVWKHILEDEGYDVELKEMEAGLVFKGLSTGDVDLFLDGWLPTTHASYMKKYGDDIEQLTTWYKGATLNIAVPKYVKDVNSVADLKSHASEFDGKMIGIEDSAGLTKTTKEKVIPDYGLKGALDLKTSGTPAMLVKLDKSIKAKDPVVVTLWHPHWAYSKFDLKDLKDPKGSLGKGEKIVALSSKDFKSEKSKAAKMIEKFKMDDKTLAGLEEYTAKKYKDDPEKGAEKWLEENPDFAKSVK